MRLVAEACIEQSLTGIFDNPSSRSSRFSSVLGPDCKAKIINENHQISGLNLTKPRGIVEPQLPVNGVEADARTFPRKGSEHRCAQERRQPHLSGAKIIVE